MIRFCTAPCAKRYLVGRSILRNKQDYKPSHWIGIFLSALILGPIIGGYVGMVLGNFLELGHNTAMLIILVAFLFIPLAGVTAAFIIGRRPHNPD